MLVVNTLGGPGAGKTHAAWNLAAELKRMGYVVEYVPEYAKELVWENRLDKLADQEALFQEQFRRINRLNGKIDIAVTDSPLILSEIYGEWNSPQFTKDIFAGVNRFENFNIVVCRDESRFEQAGRLQNMEDSIQLDKKILKLLDENRIYYGTYTHERLSYLSDNIRKTIERINCKAVPIERKIQMELERMLIEHDNVSLTDFISSASQHYTGSEIRQSLETWTPVSNDEKQWLNLYNNNIFNNRNGCRYVICGQSGEKSLLFSLSGTPQPFIVATNLSENEWDHGKYFSGFDEAREFYENCCAEVEAL